MLTNDPFRQFQEELAALDAQSPKPEPTRLEQAKAEFLTVKRRYGLSVADVVTFFPEDEGIEYFAGLMATPQRPAKKPAR